MLGIIINPKSGKRAFRAQRLYLWKLLKKRHQPFAYRVTRYAGHATELARELVEKGYDEILILGGDGTLSEVINGIMRAQITEEQRSRVAFGLMPRGTGNDWGRYWGLDRRFKKSLDRFFSGTCRPVDVGCITFLRNGEEHRHYFINSVGFGVDSLCCEKAADLKYYVGSHSLNYFFALLVALNKQQPLPVTITADGCEVFSGRLYTMNIGNGPFSGGGIRQNPQADPQDGIFHVMCAKKPVFREVMQAVPRLFNGGLTALDFIRTFTGSDISITTRQHLRIEADGIINHFSGSCRVQCLHHALQMRV
jgi:diacylglycerol kinase (ATP)